MTNRYIEKTFSISNHQGNTNQNHNVVLHLAGWLLSKRQETTNIGGDVNTIGGNMNCYNHYGKHNGSSSKK